MLTAEAHVETHRASRHLVQVCRHASQMSRRAGHRARHGDGEHAAPEMKHVDWTDTHGTIDVGWGRCTLEATTTTLTLRAEAADEGSLRRLQEMIGSRVEAIGSRDRLRVTWEQPAALTAVTAEPAVTTPARHRRVWTIVLVAAVVLAVGVHVSLIAFVVVPRWTSWAADVVLAAVLVKVVAGAVLGRAAHHRLSGWRHWRARGASHRLHRH
jgi:hypothetical protein